MDRRAFIRGCLAGVATVAIALKMAQEMPALDLPDVKFKATERFSTGWVDYRGLYATPPDDCRGMVHMCNTIA